VELAVQNPNEVLERETARDRACLLGFLRERHQRFVSQGSERLLLLLLLGFLFIFGLGDFVGLYCCCWVGAVLE
jgi:hypothetical protein